MATLHEILMHEDADDTTNS